MTQDKGLRVRVRRSRYLALTVREWGVPAGGYVGRAWRFGPDDAPMMAAIVLRGAESIVEFADVDFVDDDGAERFPPGWRNAFASYTRQWPASASAVACWASLSDRQRIRIALDILSPDMPGKQRDAIGEYSRRRTAAAILGGAA